MAHQTMQDERLLTGEELFLKGDTGPCELVDGRVVPMSPTGWQHGRIEIRLGMALERFVQQCQLGWVVVGEVGIYIRRNPDTVRGADVAFLSKDRTPEGPPAGFLTVAPEVVIEIVSPTDRRQDLQEKIEDYFAADVDQVWVVEPATRSFQVFDSPADMRKFTEEDHFEAEGALKGFSLRISDLFEG